MRRAGCLVFVVIVLGVLALAGMGLWGMYNNLVAQNEQVANAWAQVRNVLQRRADLIPNLVETVKGYAAHEKDVFKAVADARGRLAGAVTPHDAATANAGLTSALGRLFAIAEAYPTLKANENFIRLQDELAGTENRITVERMRYNETVRAFNTSIKTFPAVFVAKYLGFTPHDYFESSPEAQEAPKVKF